MAVLKNAKESFLNSSLRESENIEKTLKEQDLIILKDITEDNFNVEGISYLEAYGPSCDNDLIHFVLEMNQREGLMLNTEGFIRDFSLMRGAYPEDYKLFVLRKLINQKYFDDTRHLVAIIIDLGLNTQKALFEYFPGMNYASFCRYQEEIYKVIDEHTPERIKIMKEAMATLKEKQWNALKAYYITHNKKMSMEKLAHKMGISKETFRDRLNGAKKKIKKYFESKNKETEICFDLLWQDGSQESYNELMA